MILGEGGGKKGARLSKGYHYSPGPSIINRLESVVLPKGIGGFAQTQKKHSQSDTVTDVTKGLGVDDRTARRRITK